MAVGGDSAGGNLAAGVARVAAGDGGPAPIFQLLFYPWLDLSRKRESYRVFGEGFYLTEAELDWYRHQYLTEEADALDPRCSPLLADDLSGVAPAYVATAGFDPLRDEGEEYADRLRAAGVRWRRRRDAGCLGDRKPGSAVHGLRPEEVSATLELFEAWGDVDRSHRKLAHRGSYLGLVWVSAATVRRVLAAHGLVLKRPRRVVRQPRRPFPEWADYKRNSIWIYDVDTPTSPAARSTPWSPSWTSSRASG